VDEVTHWLPAYERIRRFVLLDQEFTIASGELSATLKIKRRVVEERRQAEIEEMFMHRPPQTLNPSA
jgi:long-chain acyl-CoA synthetase